MIVQKKILYWEKKLRPDRGGATIKPFKNRYRYGMILKSKLHLPNKALKLVLGGDPELVIQRSSFGNLKHNLLTEISLSLLFFHR